MKKSKKSCQHTKVVDAHYGADIKTTDYDGNEAWENNWIPEHTKHTVVYESYGMCKCTQCGALIAQWKCST